MKRRLRYFGANSSGYSPQESSNESNLFPPESSTNENWELDYPQSLQPVEETGGGVLDAMAKPFVSLWEETKEAYQPAIESTHQFITEGMARGAEKLRLEEIERKKRESRKKVMVGLGTAVLTFIALKTTRG